MAVALDVFGRGLARHFHDFMSTMTTSHSQSFYIGTAAWALPKASQPKFAPLGSHLERYASRLRGVEINSSFYRDHKPSTYAKWAGAVPEHFRFSVKLSNVFTHAGRLEETSGLREVFDGYLELAKKLGVILVQLPPSLAFDVKSGARFFGVLRKYFDGGIALEPRHLSWASVGARKVLERYQIAKVVADPERCPFEEPVTSAGLAYYRLHGSPVIYRSDYDEGAVREWERRLRGETAHDVWCVFDNTALGFATENALSLAARFGAGQLAAA